MTPLHDLIEKTVVAMGYELVDIEYAGRGLLRVFIDVAAGSAGGDAFIQMRDCEQVSHQLSHVLTVEQVDYSRLEVSSPGVDRPLNKPADFERFAGAEVSIRLRAPFKGRRNFAGVLVRETDADGQALAGDAPGAQRWGLDLTPAPEAATAARKRGARTPKGRGVASPNHSTKAKGAGAEPPADADVVTRLSFTLEEVERARLVPKLKF